MQRDEPAQRTDPCDPAWQLAGDGFRCCQLVRWRAAVALGILRGVQDTPRCAIDLAGFSYWIVGHASVVSAGFGLRPRRGLGSGSAGLCLGVAGKSLLKRNASGQRVLKRLGQPAPTAAVTHPRPASLGQPVRAVLAHQRAAQIMHRQKQRIRHGIKSCCIVWPLTAPTAVSG